MSTEKESNPTIAGSPAHTPGPWTAYKGWADSVYMDNEATLKEHPDWCEVVGGSFEKGSRISVSGHFGIANARLIAAAPAPLSPKPRSHELFRTGQEGR